jgi:hypothetical protein
LKDEWWNSKFLANTKTMSLEKQCRFTLKQLSAIEQPINIAPTPHNHRLHRVISTKLPGRVQN